VEQETKVLKWIRGIKLKEQVNKIVNHLLIKMVLALITKIVRILDIKEVNVKIMILKIEKMNRFQMITPRVVKLNLIK